MRKPFNLAAAKAGAPLVTRGGRPAKLIAYVEDALPGQRLLVLIGRCVFKIFEDGRHISPNEESKYDLFMAPTKRTVWVNLYEYGEARYQDTEADADACASDDRLGGRAWPVEIEV